MAVELRNLLGKATERTFPATLTLDHPSVAALTEHLAREAFADEIAEDLKAPNRTGESDFEGLSVDELAQQLMQRLDSMSEREPL